MKNLKLALLAVLVFACADQVVAAEATGDFNTYTVKTEDGIYINADGHPSITVKESKYKPNDDKSRDWFYFHRIRCAAKWAYTYITPNGIEKGQFDQPEIPTGESNWRLESSFLDRTDNSIIARIGIAKKCKAYETYTYDAYGAYGSEDKAPYIHLDCGDTQIELHNLLSESEKELVANQNKYHRTTLK